MKKYLFGLFTFSLGLALGLLFDTLIRKFIPGENEMLKGALIVLTVAVTFFIWRWAERPSTKKHKSGLPEPPGNY